MPVANLELFCINMIEKTRDLGLRALQETATIMTSHIPPESVLAVFAMGDDVEPTGHVGVASGG